MDVSSNSTSLLVGVILGVIIGVCVLVAIVLLLVRRHKRGASPPTVTPVHDVGGQTDGYPQLNGVYGKLGVSDSYGALAVNGADDTQGLYDRVDPLDDDKARVAVKAVTPLNDGEYGVLASQYSPAVLIESKRYGDPEFIQQPTSQYGSARAAAARRYTSPRI